MAKIIYNKSKCIGAGECAKLSPAYWTMDNGRATLKGAVLNGSVYEREIPPEEVPQQKRIAASCPACCIKLQ